MRMVVLLPSRDLRPYHKSVLRVRALRLQQQLKHQALSMCVDVEILIGEHSVCQQAEPEAATDAAAEPEEDVQMEELEHEIEAAAAPEEPEEAEDELAGEAEEENTGKPPHNRVPAYHFTKGNSYIGSCALLGS